MRSIIDTFNDKANFSMSMTNNLSDSAFPFFTVYSPVISINFGDIISMNSIRGIKKRFEEISRVPTGLLLDHSPDISSIFLSSKVNHQNNLLIIIPGKCEDGDNGSTLPLFGTYSKNDLFEIYNLKNKGWYYDVKSGKKTVKKYNGLYDRQSLKYDELYDMTKLTLKIKSPGKFVLRITCNGISEEIVITIQESNSTKSPFEKRLTPKYDEMDSDGIRRGIFVAGNKTRPASHIVSFLKKNHGFQCDGSLNKKREHPSRDFINDVGNESKVVDYINLSTHSVGYNLHNLAFLLPGETVRILCYKQIDGIRHEVIIYGNKNDNGNKEISLESIKKHEVSPIDFVRVLDSTARTGEIVVANIACATNSEAAFMYNKLSNNADKVTFIATSQQSNFGTKKDIFNPQDDESLALLESFISSENLTYQEMSNRYEAFAKYKVLMPHLDKYVKDLNKLAKSHSSSFNNIVRRKQKSKNEIIDHFIKTAQLTSALINVEPTLIEKKLHKDGKPSQSHTEILDLLKSFHRFQNYKENDNDRAKLRSSIIPLLVLNSHYDYPNVSIFNLYEDCNNLKECNENRAFLFKAINSQAEYTSHYMALQTLSKLLKKQSTFNRRKPWLNSEEIKILMRIYNTKPIDKNDLTANRKNVLSALSSIDGALNLVYKQEINDFENRPINKYQLEKVLLLLNLSPSDERIKQRLLKVINDNNEVISQYAPSDYFAKYIYATNYLDEGKRDPLQIIKDQLSQAIKFENYLESAASNIFKYSNGDWLQSFYFSLYFYTSQKKGSKLFQNIDYNNFIDLVTSLNKLPKDSSSAIDLFLRSTVPSIFTHYLKLSNKNSPSPEELKAFRIIYHEMPIIIEERVNLLEHSKNKKTTKKKQQEIDAELKKIKTISVMMEKGNEI